MQEQHQTQVNSTSRTSYESSSLDRKGAQELSQLYFTSPNQRVTEEALRQWAPDESTRIHILGLAIAHVRELYYRSAREILAVIGEDPRDPPALCKEILTLWNALLRGTKSLGANDIHRRGVETLQSRWSSYQDDITDYSGQVCILGSGTLVNELRKLSPDAIIDKQHLEQQMLLAAEDLFKHEVYPWIVTLLMFSNELGGVLSEDDYRRIENSLDDVIARRDLIVTKWHKEAVLPPRHLDRGLVGFTKQAGV
jgi:hypothetical protein